MGYPGLSPYEIVMVMMVMVMMVMVMMVMVMVMMVMVMVMMVMMSGHTCVPQRTQFRGSGRGRGKRKVAHL